MLIRKFFRRKYACLLLLSLAVCLASECYADDVVNNPTVGGRQDSSEMIFGQGWSKPHESAAMVNRNNNNSRSSGGGVKAVVNANTPPKITAAPMQR